jgi:FtsZ-binding cell division protein ZapB
MNTSSQPEVASSDANSTPEGEKFEVGSLWSYDGFLDNPVTFEVLSNNNIIRYRQRSGKPIDTVYSRMDGYFSIGSTMYEDSKRIAVRRSTPEANREQAEANNSSSRETEVAEGKRTVTPQVTESREGEVTYEQPNYKHLWEAFVAGAREARANPQATEKHFNLAADAHCKLIHSELDPVMFRQLAEDNISAADNQILEEIGEKLETKVKKSALKSMHVANLDIEELQSEIARLSQELQAAEAAGDKVVEFLKYTSRLDEREFVVEKAEQLLKGCNK